MTDSLVTRKSVLSGNGNPVHPAVVWVAAAICLIVNRYRGRAVWYVAFHRWMDGIGLPSWARNLDGTLVLIIGGVLIWLLVRRSGIIKDTPAAGGFREDFGFKGGFARAAGVSLIMLLPMALLPFAVGGGLVLHREMIRSCAGAALGEEFFYRGALILVLVRHSTLSPLVAAAVSSVFFGLTHMTWTFEGVGSGWPNFIVTGIGGLWFAWLAIRWGTAATQERPLTGNLWVPMMLHAGMNMTWEWYAAAGSNPGGAVGGVWANVGRAGTIALSIVLTRRMNRANDKAARD